MRIIRRGNDPKSRKWRGTCPNCNSKMEATREELRQIEYDQREDGEFGRADCPVCSASVVFYPQPDREEREVESG